MQVTRLRVIQPPDVAGGDQLLDEARAGHAAIGKESHMSAPELLGPLQHLLCLSRTQRQRLFADHVRARFQRGQRHRSVLVIGREHDGDIRIHLRQHLSIIGERAWDAVFARQRRQPFRVAAAERNQINAREGAQAGQVRAVGPPTGSDNGGANTVGHRLISSAFRVVRC